MESLVVRSTLFLIGIPYNASERSFRVQLWCVLLSLTRNTYCYLLTLQAEHLQHFAEQFNNLNKFRYFHQ